MKTTYREAMRAAIREAMARDDRVFMMGEDVGAYGGCFAVSLGLLEEFRPERIRDTPLSETGFEAAGIGAALGGMRPIVEIMTVNPSLLALGQIMNNAATLSYMSGGQFSVPVVIRMTTGAGRQLAAQHSHGLEGWYAHIPGLRILTPSSLADARGMLWSALQDPDPVLIFEHGSLYNTAGELDDDAGAVDIDTAVVIDEGWRSGSISAEISARITETAFFDLDSPVGRVCSAEVPLPYARHLEQAAPPSAARVIAAAREAVGTRG